MCNSAGRKTVLYSYRKSLRYIVTYWGLGYTVTSEIGFSLSPKWRISAKADIQVLSGGEANQLHAQAI
jgi:hypothetical protein